LVVVTSGVANADRQESINRLGMMVGDKHRLAFTQHRRHHVGRQRRGATLRAPEVHCGCQYEGADQREEVRSVQEQGEDDAGCCEGK